VESTLAIATLDRAVDDDVHSLGNLHNRIRVADIDLPGIVRRVDRNDVGDAKLMMAFEGFDDVGSELALSA
jgi:hypothetical protein